MFEHTTLYFYGAVSFYFFIFAISILILTYSFKIYSEVSKPVPEYYIEKEIQNLELEKKRKTYEIELQKEKKKIDLEEYKKTKLKALESLKDKQTCYNNVYQVQALRIGGPMMDLKDAYHEHAKFFGDYENKYNIVLDRQQNEQGI